MSSLYGLKQLSLVVDKIREGKYPSKKALLLHLENNDCEVSPRTFDRILEKLRDQMGLDVEYDIQQKGYFLANDANGLADKFLTLIEIGRSAEVLTETIRENRENLRYIHPGNNKALKGLHQVGIILQAIREQRVITFMHGGFSSGISKEVILHPLLIKEYEDRWYVYGWSHLLSEYRTYGIDRISDVRLTEEHYEPHSNHDAARQFDDMIGVTMSDSPATNVVLRFTRFQSNYIKTLPWHHSQTILSEDDDFCIVRLHVRPNHELVQKILSSANQVVVLEPEGLKEEIKVCLAEMYSQYGGEG